MSETYKDVYIVDNNIETEHNEKVYYLNRLQILLGELKPIYKLVDVIENGRLKKKEIKISLAFVKGIEEIIQNSADIFIKTLGKYANKLKVTIDGNRITISDNGSGTGIPMDKVEAAFTNFRTSSNFEWKKEEGFERVSGSQNGIGSKATNVASTFFEVTNITLDGKRGILTCKNNMNDINFKVDDAPKSAKPGVTVSFELDQNIFGVTEDMMPDIINHIHALLLNLNVTYPQMEITYQNQLIKIKQFSDYIKYISDNAVILHDDEQLSIASYPSEEFGFIFSANSINLPQGGNVLTYTTNSIIAKFTERLQKGYKSISNSHVKNKLGFVVILRNVTNLAFGGGQSKTSLTNTYTELGLPTLNYTEFAEKLFKSSAIKDPIIELYKIQAELEKRKAMNGLKADKKEIFNPKHMKATQDSEFLMIAEGDSALSSLPLVFGREKIGYLPLTGKLLNSLKSKPDQIRKNPRVVDIIEAYGIGLEESRYNNLIIATDADLDGNHITTLIISLFYVLQPQDLYDGKLYKLNTPVMVITDKNDKLVKWYYSLNDYNQDKHNINPSHNCIHKKGLGSHTSEDLAYIVEKDGLENMIEQIVVTPEDGEIIEKWMTDEGVLFRQDVLRSKAFSIENI